MVAAVPAATSTDCRRDACRHSGLTRSQIALHKFRRSMRAHALIQFTKRSLTGRSGIERFSGERNFRRCGNDELHKDKIDHCRCGIFSRRARKCAKNLAALIVRALRFGFIRLGMKRATRRVRFCDKSVDDTVIRKREPRANRNRDDQATRGCFHNDSIAERARFLKYFLLARALARLDPSSRSPVGRALLRSSVCPRMSAV